LDALHGRHLLDIVLGEHGLERLLEPLLVGWLTEDVDVVGTGPGDVADHVGLDARAEGRERDDRRDADDDADNGERRPEFVRTDRPGSDPE